jgi:WD40 repeat protein
MLLGHRLGISALAFSPTDSNLLASGSWQGEIKLWDVMNQVCIHAFDPQLVYIRAIFFSPGDNMQCYAATISGQMIRIVRNERMEFASTILEEPSHPFATFSPCGTFFAAISEQELALFDLRTLAKTQSVVLSGDQINLAGIAMSPDGKKLATTESGKGIRLFECHDLTIQKHVDTIEQSSDEAVGFWPVAFDPTSRVFAVGCIDGRVELGTIS